MIILFWASIVLVVYTYLGYPLFLWGLTKIRARDVRRSEIFPSVSIIIAARNEAEKIRQKIENTLTLNYPADRLEVIVASDASDDGTDNIVQAYSTRACELAPEPALKLKPALSETPVVPWAGDGLVAGSGGVVGSDGAPSTSAESEPPKLEVTVTSEGTGRGATGLILAGISSVVLHRIYHT